MLIGAYCNPCANVLELVEMQQLKQRTMDILEHTNKPLIAIGDFN